MLEVGDKIPQNIKVKDDEGNDVSLKDYSGKTLVLFFYPKDFTPGCTVESCELRDYYSKIKNAGAELIGVSKDNVASHKRFKAKHELPYPLWADPERVLLDAFGVIKEKKMFGKPVKGTHRSTFIIDPKGTILKMWPKVTPLGHAKEVLKYLKSL